MIHKLFRRADISWSLGGMTICVVFFIVDTIFHIAFIRTPFERVSQVFQPVQRTFQVVLQKPITWVAFVRHGSQRIEELERQHAELRTQLSELETLKKENTQLRLTLEKGGNPQPNVQFQATANVLKGGNFWSIDKGEKDGVRVGDIVFAHGVVVGRVQQVTPLYGAIDLLHAGQLQFVAKTSQAADGVVLFEQGQLWLKYVNIDQTLSVGDSIFTSGTMERFVPADLYIGEVIEVIKDTNSSVMKARIDQGISLNSLEVVMVRGFQER